MIGELLTAIGPPLAAAPALASAAGYFRQVEGPLAASQLVLAMLGMGATLRVEDFLAIQERWRAILFVLAAQFLLCPLLVALLGHWLPLPAGVGLGILLLAAMPSGSLSNVFTYLGGGNVPLSITATVGSTVTCLLCTPLVLDLLATAALPADFQLPILRIIRDVLLYLLIPVGVGMLVRRRWPGQAPRFSKWTVRASMVVLSVIVVGSLTSGRIDVWAYGWLIPVVLVLFVCVQFAAAGLFTLLLRYSLIDAYTVAIEVALRNGNLAILLSSTMFPPAAAADERLSAGALYVALFYGGASLVFALLTVGVRHALGRWLGGR